MRIRGFLIACILVAWTHNAHALSLVRITGISDISVPSWGVTDPAIATHVDICIYSSSGSYTVTASNLTGFNLFNGLNALAYTLKWEDSGAGHLGSSGGTQLTNGVTLTSQINANTSSNSNDCSTGSPAGPTARLYLNIAQSALIAALAGTYSGSITLTVGGI